MTTIRPSNSGSEPSTRPQATMKPQVSMGTGLALTTATEVRMAVPIRTFRSSNIGKEITLIESTSRAKRKPAPQPKMIKAQPGPVVRTSERKPVMDTGVAGTERQPVDQRRHPQPDCEDHCEDQAEAENRAEGGRAEHIERVRPGHLEPLFAPPAHFIEADGGDRSDQGKARNQREDQRQHVVAKSELAENEAGERIDQADEDHIGPVLAKVLEPLGQGIPEVREFDMANGRCGRVEFPRRTMKRVLEFADAMRGDLDDIHAPFHGISASACFSLPSLFREATTA